MAGPIAKRAGRFAGSRSDSPPRARLRTHVGCSGWYYWRWRNSFYPEDMPTKEWFAHYASVFGAVELNGPFYHWPRPATVKSWRKSAPAGFRYAVKVNRAITHERRMVGTRRLVRKFYKIAETLGSSMGCFLFQFPPSFRYTPSRLKSLVAQLDPSFRNVVEFRHGSWWRESVYRALAKSDITFCSVSAPRLPEDLIRTTSMVYVRFHGRPRWYRHDYSRDELKEWSRKIRASGAGEAWGFFNNDYDGCAVKNARTLEKIIRRPSRTYA